MDAYLDGLEQAAANGHQLAGIASVASFFVSRVDTEIDKRLEAIGTEEALALRGKAAIANARLAYAALRGGVRRRAVGRAGGQGANAQRPLWASTGVKNPEYSDTLYVIELVVADTVNTMPEKTMHAVADHGVIRGRPGHRHRAAQAQEVFDALAAGRRRPDRRVRGPGGRGRREVREVLDRAARDRQGQLDAAK